METICIKSQILFPAKNKENIINLSSAEYAHRVVNVKRLHVEKLVTDTAVVLYSTLLSSLFFQKPVTTLRVFDRTVS